MNLPDCAPGDERDVAQNVVVRLRGAGCVFAEDEARLLIDSAEDRPHLERLVAQRCAGLPLEHVLGWADFHGMRITVAPGVFVPRRRTELLVREALRELPSRAPATVVDLCCGTGAVGAAIAVSADEPVRVHAVDIDPAAVACARRNLAALAPVHRVHLGDLYTPLPPSLHGAVDLIVANAPYVPTAEIALMPPEAREHEPVAALDGGSDGLDVHRRIAAAAPRWLAPRGRLLIETSDRQAERTAAAATDAGLRVRIAREDGATVLVAAR